MPNINELCLAIRNGDLETVIDACNQGFEVNTTDQYGDTLLHAAIMKYNLQLSEFLIQFRSIIDIQNYRNGSSPLILAIESGATNIAELLIRNGANIHLRNLHDETPLHAAVKYNELSIAELLIQQGADVNAIDDMHFTPLHLSQNNTNMAEFLMKNGADLYAVDRNNNTPLDFLKSRLNGVVNDMENCIIKYAMREKIRTNMLILFRLSQQTQPAQDQIQVPCYELSHSILQYLQP